MERFRALADPLPETIPEIITTDDICADYIIHHLRGAPSGSVALIDYLQILDQKRTKPPLSDQVKALQAFTRSTGAILSVIAQIDRSYASEAASVPGFTDLRLPNPIPASIFSKACFLNAGEVRLQSMV